MIAPDINRVRSGNTTEKTTIVDKSSLTSRGLLTQKKTIPGRKKKIRPSSGQKMSFENAHSEH